MSDANVYETPAIDPGMPRLAGNPRAVSIGRGWGWIADGFGHFKQNPGAWILTLIVGFVIMIVLSFIPLLGQLALWLTNYVWIAGLMIGCRAQAGGGNFEVGYLFAGFSNSRVGSLMLLSVIMAILTIVIMVIAIGPVFWEMLKGGAESDQALMESMSDLQGFWLPFLIGMLFLIPLMMTAWFAPALIALNNVPLFKAMKLSVIGCAKNVIPFLLYGIVGLILVILASIPLGLGFLVLGPVLVASIYVSYKEIFTE